jgi:hypothetical protein
LGETTALSTFLEPESCGGEEGLPRFGVGRARMIAAALVPAISAVPN